MQQTRIQIIFCLLCVLVQVLDAQNGSNQQFPSIYELNTIMSLIFLSVLCGLAQAGGLGGGPILSPMMMLLLGMGQRKAVWNTQVMMFGGSVGSYLKLSSDRVKTTGAPIINYKLVLISMPMLLAGSILGVTSGKSLPKVFITILLIVVLVSVVIKTTRVYKRMKAQEDSNFTIDPSKKEKWVELIYCEEEYHGMSKSAYTFDQKYVLKPSDVDFKRDIRHDQLQLTSLTSDLIFKSPQLLQIYEEEKTIYPKRIILNLLLQLLIVLFIVFLKGSQLVGSIANIRYCSLQYHMCTVLLIGIGFVSIKYYSKIFNEEEDDKEARNYDFNREGRLKPMIMQTVKASLLAGFLGGFVGLGGGTILTPIWLESGIPAQRATASATVCVMFNSFVSLFQIAYSGGYTIQEFTMLMISSVVGSYVVAGFLKILVAKFKRDSIIILILLSMVILSLVVVPIKAFIEIKNNPGDAFEFHRFC